MPSKAPRAAAVYTRISRDRTGEALGVQLRQRPDLEALAERKGWRITEVYTDNDISASRKRGKVAHRPDYQRLCADITAGRIDGVLAWELDRIFRDPLEAEEFWLRCERAGMVHFATLSDDLDITTGDGIMIARIKAAVAAEEARKTAQRTRRKALELADRGLPPGGRRHFGYTRTRTIDPDEAPIVRELVQRATQGERLFALCRDLNTRGITTTMGAPWQVQSLRKLLLSPAITGLRVHQGAVHGSAVWQPIIDRTTWDTCRAVIEGRTVRRGPYGSHLLTGIARCSTCGHTVYGGASAKNRPARYSCAGHLAIPVPLLDQTVERAVLTQLDARAIAAHEPGSPDLDDALAAVAELEHRHAELAADYYTDHAITPAQFAAANKRIQGRLDSAKRRAATLATDDSRRALLSDPAVLVDAWSTLPLEHRRLVIDALVTVTVHPGTPRVASTIDRIEIQKRD